MNAFTELLLFAALFFTPGHFQPSSPSANSVVESDDECILEFDDCDKKEKYKQVEPKSVICYFTEWSQERSGKGRFTGQDVDASLCTHINYAFGTLDPKTLTITTPVMTNKFFEQVSAYKAKGVKVLMSLGGYDESVSGDKWTRLIREPAAHVTFISTTVEFLKKFNLDGLDIAYEFPACPRGLTKEERLKSDKEDFNTLLTDLKAAFKENQFLLSVTASTGKSTVEQCYNMPQICQIVDWVSVITYNYHGSSDGETGAVAPMCGTSTSWGVLDAVKFYLNDVKCPADKVVLGISTFASTYTLDPKSQPGFGEAVSGPGTAGAFTKYPGFMAYYETCLPENRVWHTGYNSVNGSYAWHDQDFISVPSKVDMERKSCLVKHYNLKGVMIWTLDYDDFNDMCGCGKYPLIKTLNQHLRAMEISDIHC